MAIFYLIFFSQRKEVVMEGDQRKEIQRLLSDIKSDRGEQNMPETGDQSQSRYTFFFVFVFVKY